MSERKLDPGASQMLRKMADLVDSGQATAVVALAVVEGQRLYYHGWTDGFAAADLVLGTMDLVDSLREQIRGRDEPLPDEFASVIGQDDGLKRD
jgi:hypothetical protein